MKLLRPARRWWAHRAGDRASAPPESDGFVRARLESETFGRQGGVG